MKTIVNAVLISMFVLCSGGTDAFARVITLDQAFDIGLKNNPSIEAAKIRIKQAEESIKEVKASWFPSMEAVSSVTRKEISDNSLAAAPAGTDKSEELYSTGLSASWIVFAGFERKYQCMAAELTRRQSTASLADAQRILVAAIADTYFSAQLALKNRAIAEADKEFNLEQLKEAEIKKEVGTGSLSDLYNFQIKVNTADAQIEEAACQYDIARAALAALLGIADPLKNLPKPAFLAPENSKEMVMPDIQKFTKTALNKRPDIKSQVFGIKKADAEIGAAKAKYWPTISLNGNLNADRTSSSRFENSDIASTVSLGFSYPIFQGGKNQAALYKAMAVKTETEKNFETLKTEITSKVMQAGCKVISSQKQLKIQRKNTLLVEKTRNLVEFEYKAGQTSLVRLNEAQKELTTARGRLALALVNLRQAWYQLKSAAGIMHISAF